jgi:hypothetical protein
MGFGCWGDGAGLTKEVMLMKRACQSEWEKIRIYEG